jgi:hypothetical protein
MAIQFVTQYPAPAMATILSALFSELVAPIALLTGIPMAS